MFDIGTLELVLISVVALLVVGPERFPKLARSAGLWVGRARRMLSAVKADIDREIKSEELKEILRKQAQSKPLETILETRPKGPVKKDETPASDTPAATGPTGKVESD